MKIECDKCAAKYSIADEKVRGKTFKIRCKKCSNVIIVRDKGAAADAGGDDAEEEHGDPGWHLAINGETVGPLAEDEVRDRYGAGEIDKDTAIWQEGFEDWIPLGDVSAFADLPDAPAGDAGFGGHDDGYGQDEDDPFANANQEDYAAGAAAAASAAVAAHQPQSPRVSALTGQRNENSVLFSLDSLQQMATGGNRGGAAAASKPTAGTNQSGGPKGLATTAPGSEGSGLIDIRALGSMVGSDAPGGGHGSSPSADDAALPSFGGSGLGGLAAAPLVASHAPEPASAAAAAAPPPPQRSNAPIYVLMVVLILALGGLAAYILLKPDQQPQVIVKEVPGAAPSVADKDEDDDEDDEKRDEDEDDEKRDEDADEEGESEGENPEADAASEKSGSGNKRSDRKSTRKSSGKSSPKKSDSKNDDPLAGFGDPPPKKKSAGAKKKSGGDVSVDCILDPSKCSKGAKKTSPGSTSQPKADSNLPNTLTSSDIRAGVAPYKAAAKSCGGKHGAPAGTKVKVKLSISGSTGTVTSASAQPPHNGTPLGNCVAAAVKKSKFKKFQKPTLGAVYPFTM